MEVTRATEVKTVFSKLSSPLSMPKEQKPNQEGFYLSIQIPIEWKLGKSGCVLDVSDKSRQRYIRSANGTALAKSIPESLQ